MARTRDFLAEAFKAIGTNMLDESMAPLQGTPAPATPLQMQEEANQPPHARGPVPPTEGLEPWFFVGAQTTKIPAEWAEALWKKIEAGVRYNLRAAAPGSDSGSPPKKQRM